MTRGRKALPDEIKRLKGNPGKRRLNLDQGDDAAVRKIDVPKYLTAPTQKEIFKRVADEINRLRFIRHTDVDGLARWSYYLAKWIGLKKRVDAKNADVYYETKSKHGKMLRTHPIFASLLQIERVLVSLEDRLGLNPVSRQQIVRGIFAGPPLAPGALFDQNSPGTKPQAPEAAPDPAPSAIGFLN